MSEIPVVNKQKSNREIMQNARELLHGNWKLPIGFFLLYFVINLALECLPGSGILINLLISGVLDLGVAFFLLAFINKNDPQIMQLFTGLPKFDIALCLYLVRLLYIILWTLLLIIPGIITCLKYSQAFFILAENPDLKTREILQKSDEMMYGHKLSLFYLYLRFTGWALLAVLSFGIGFIWLIPYVEVSRALFYKNLKS